MKVNPKSKEELQAMNLITPGIYDYQIIEAEEKISKSGAEMIALKLKIWDINGLERIVFDYLLDAMAHKLFHFVECHNLLDQYNNGVLTANDCLNKCGKVEIIVQKDKTGQYGDKNSVKDYILPVNVKSSSAKPLSVENGFKDDDIPF